MSSAAWHHLPHDPRSFFGLEDGFDRRDLKRAYGKLIREYKPETHPAEFQRIRAAYEQLENAQRYGRSQASAQSAADAWDNAKSDGPRAEATGTRAAEPSMPVPLSPVDAAMADPRETYARLAKQPSRSPQEHYILAVLSDLVDPPEKGAAWRPKFLQWLLQGLHQHPGDSALTALVAGTLRNDVPAAKVAKLLPAIAKTVRSPIFYRLTEPLWERFLRDHDFAVFEALLSQCESHLRQTDPRGRLAFFLRILRTAIWKAPMEWTEARIDEIERQAADLDDSMQADLEFISLLRDHLSSTTPELSAMPARKRIETFLYEYCVSTGPSAMAKVTQCLDEIARDAHGMRDAFATSDDRDDTPLLLLTMMATSDLAESTGLVTPPVDDVKNNRQAVSCLNDLRNTLTEIGNKINWINSKYKWGPFTVVYIGFGLLSTMLWGGLSVVTDQMIASDALEAFMILPLIGSLIAFPFIYFKWFYPKKIEPRSDAARNNYFAECYETRWRERLFRFVQSCGESPNESLSRLQGAADYKDDSGWMHLVLGFCSHDVGLLIFARAQLFLT